MPLGAAIAGVISDERGGPPPKHFRAPVAVASAERRTGPVPSAKYSTGTTDNRGAYRFYGLKPGKYTVSAVRPAGPPPPRALTVAEVDAALKGQVEFLHRRLNLRAMFRSIFLAHRALVMRLQSC